MYLGTCRSGNSGLSANPAVEGRLNEGPVSIRLLPLPGRITRTSAYPDGVGRHPTQCRRSQFFGSATAIKYRQVIQVW